MKRNSYYADAYEEACSVIDKICQDDAIEESSTADTANLATILNEIEIKKDSKD